MFKFHCPSPMGNVCALHDVEMEIILGDPAPLTVRYSDGTEQTQEARSVCGYRHALTDSYDAADSCEYRHEWHTYRVTRTFPDLWRDRTIQCVWSIVDGTPQWVLSDPASGEHLLTVSGHLHTLGPDASAAHIKTYVVHVLTHGAPNFQYPPHEAPETPYHKALLNLMRALIDRGVLCVPLGGNDYGFEINSTVRALELDIFEPNYLHGRSERFLQGAAMENDESIEETRDRAESPGEYADWFDHFVSVLKKGVTVRLYGENYMVLPMKATRRLAQHSAIREAVRLAIAESEVLMAIAHHGHYDPANGHEPPPGQELDAIERREEFHDRMDAAFSGLGNLFGWREPDRGDA